ncbi:MAG TPA: SOS response-associated peptidase [Ktedonobacterales bacterium]|nr:SOS response-associated peptidase [Ktedonobacterales bacterium]
MCGRYVLKNAGQIPLRFGATADAAVQAALVDHYNIAPTTQVPVVVEATPGERRVELVTWGITPHRQGSKAFLAFNARAESLIARPTFRPLVARSRCLVPASGWYEWQAMAGQKTKQPWYITDPEGDDLLGLAGLLDRWTDAQGTPHAACAIVTTAAATDDLRALHDRMPAVLPRTAEAAWLDPGLTDPGAVLPFLQHPDATRLRRWPVSPAVNRSGHSEAHLVVPLNPA